MQASISELLEQTGLQDMRDRLEDGLEPDFVTASIEAFTDGDVAVIHPMYRGQDAELYGEGAFYNGRVTQAMTATALANGTEPTPILVWQKLLAEMFADPDSDYGRVDVPNPVQYAPDALFVDGNRVPLRHPPSSVVELGACIAGRSVIRDQIMFPNLGHPPFRYQPLVQLPFMDQLLLHTYENIRPGTAHLAVARGVYAASVGPVGPATDLEIMRRQAEGLDVDGDDIIVAAPEHIRSADDIRHGLRNAHAMLREGGLLVTRALVEPVYDAPGSDDMLGWAIQAGFSEVGARKFETTAINELVRVRESRVVESTARMLVLTKQ